MKQNSNTLRFIATVLAAIVVLVASFAPSSTVLASSESDTYTPTIPVACTAFEPGEIRLIEPGCNVAGDVEVSKFAEGPWTPLYRADTGVGSVVFSDTESFYVRAPWGAGVSSTISAFKMGEYMITDGCSDPLDGCQMAEIYQWPNYIEKPLAKMPRLRAAADRMILSGKVFLNSGFKAPSGSLAQFWTPSGDVAGQAVLSQDGILPYTNLWSAEPVIGQPGFKHGDMITVTVNGQSARFLQENLTWDSSNMTEVQINRPLVTVSGDSKIVKIDAIADTQIIINRTSGLVLVKITADQTFNVWTSGLVSVEFFYEDLVVNNNTFMKFDQNTYTLTPNIHAIFLPTIAR